MAHIAEAVGATADAAALRKRSQNYRTVIDPSIDFARPRFKDGSWWKEYDPFQICHDVPKWRDYTEANGWQTPFLKQHELHGLIEHIVGDEAFENKSETL